MNAENPNRRLNIVFLSFITNDGTHGDEALKMANIPPERIYFWRNGINKDRINISETKMEMGKLEGVLLEY